MKNWYTKSTEDLCEAILSLQTKEECAAFLEDICTIKEILDISQRLAVARMLSQGVGYTTICKETGASTATISRVSKCYAYGTGGYKTVIERMNGGNGDD
jgi:TrpR-related protein YerC/YecD